jgi:hypothetical protein
MVLIKGNSPGMALIKQNIQTMVLTKGNSPGMALIKHSSQTMAPSNYNSLGMALIKHNSLGMTLIKRNSLGMVLIKRNSLGMVFTSRPLFGAPEAPQSSLGSAQSLPHYGHTGNEHGRLGSPRQGTTFCTQPQQDFSAQSPDGMAVKYSHHY